MRAAEQLHTAIGTRTLIGTAIGVLMEQYHLTQTTAFEHLVRLSSTSNRKVRVVARDIVEEAERDANGGPTLTILGVCCFRRTAVTLQREA